ncbi:MAG: outer membrane beta-barrel protein [Alphaproteobacteria bacterium]|nr:outer membrane beta-barrel protein [Alphaproteobacteria bacterium]
MKKISLIALSAITLGFTTPATAGFYGGLGIATAIDSAVDTAGVDAKTSEGNGYSVAVGYEVPLLPLRVEIESFALSNADLTQGTTNVGNRSTDGLMVNAYAGLPIPLVQPYIGVGTGMAKTLSPTYHTAYQGMIGVEVSLPVLPIAVGVEYRYFEMDEGNSDVTNQSVLAKLRVQF